MAGASRAVLEEFFEIYATLLHQEPVREKKSFSFSKYIQWIENQDKDKAHAYWREYLKGLETNTEMPRFYKKATKKGLSKREFYQKINDDLLQSLERLSKQYKSHCPYYMSDSLGFVAQSLQPIERCCIWISCIWKTT
jgi:hypothetical protein